MRWGVYMIILDVNKVGKNYGYGVLFEGVSFSLNEGETLSIVGQNGCGKSTLLKMIAGKERYDTGSISIKKDAKFSYLDQVISDKIDERNVKDILLDVFEDLAELSLRIKKYEKLMEEDNSKYLPYVVEPSVGVERMLLSVLFSGIICSFFTFFELAFILSKPLPYTAMTFDCEIRAFGSICLTALNNWFAWLARAMVVTTLPSFPE